MKKHATAALALLAAAAALLSAPAAARYLAPQADLIVVRKSERTLSLVSGTDVIRTFPIRLGANPVGHKEQSGDSRTPEGRYFIEFKNRESDFFLSLKISYPNARDRAHARQLGVAPGGNIMIHGEPVNPRFSPGFYRQTDWTDGCIAVSNTAIQEIWLAVREKTPVVIYP